MKLQITATTDGLHIGLEIDPDDNPIKLAKDKTVRVEKTIPIPGGFRLVSSNYIIDAVEVQHG